MNNQQQSQYDFFAFGIWIIHTNVTLIKTQTLFHSTSDN